MGNWDTKYDPGMFSNYLMQKGGVRPGLPTKSTVDASQVAKAFTAAMKNGKGSGMLPGGMPGRMSSLNSLGARSKFPGMKDIPDPSGVMGSSDLFGGRPNIPGFGEGGFLRAWRPGDKSKDK